MTAVYVRISIKTKVSVSLEAQEAECLALCERNGWTDVEVYRDASRSASDTRKVRPEYRRMMADTRAGRVARIVCRDDDRLVRQPIELEQLIDVLNSNGVPVFWSHGSHLDLTTIEGRMSARLAGTMARAEVEKKSARQKSSNRHRVANGSPVGTVRPLGYQRARVNGVATFDVVPDEADAIRWAADQVRTGGTLSSVAREWTSRGIMAPKTGKPYTWMAVKGALTNPYLAARIAYQPTSILTTGKADRAPKHRVELIPGNWEPILSYQEWTDLVAHVTRTRQAAGNNVKYLCGGIADCGICGAPARSDWTRTRHGVKKRVYKCDGKCWQLRAEQIDHYVRDAVVEMLTAEDLGQGDDQGPTVDRAALDAERVQLEAEMMQLADMLSRRAMTLPQFEQANRGILDRLTEISDALTEPEPGTLPDHVPVTVEQFEAQTIEQRRLLVRAVTSRVAIFPAGSPVLPPTAVYVHVYDRRGRLRPLPVGPDEVEVAERQEAHAARYATAP
ncbi:recombinase family protein [Micromonospora sp. NBC_00898]|uniref:recombinase family protein n=1 Tax=Micromonospora sp. NBC_00898 TaxID=2975981 RepID=UPI003868B6C5|nr:recombinase family protein [Micromonospora sp. NBC_00898]